MKRAANLVSIVYPFHPLGVLNAALQGPKVHLWFLPALAMAALISGAMLARGYELVLFTLAFVLFIVGLAGSAHSHTPFGFTANFNFRNGPFFGLIMFVSGYAIHRYGNGIKLLPLGIGLAVSGFGLELIESIWIYQKWGCTFKT